MKQLTRSEQNTWKSIESDILRHRDKHQYDYKTIKHNQMFFFGLFVCYFHVESDSKTLAKWSDSNRLRQPK